VTAQISLFVKLKLAKCAPVLGSTDDAMFRRVKGAPTAGIPAIVLALMFIDICAECWRKLMSLHPKFSGHADSIVLYNERS